MHKEKRIATMSGWGMLFAVLALPGGSVCGHAAQPAVNTGTLHP